MSKEITGEEIPFPLRQIKNPPEQLYYRGDLTVLDKTCISIVGTRKNSDYGEEMTHKIISELALLDITIVSGLAKGIDTIAHMAALENNLPTVAVLGSGLRNIYPPENTQLSEKITANNGLLISEYPDETLPIAYQFPQRNRIISGLSIATIVIEAAGKSGALITAQFAVDQGKDVFALPGDVDRPSSLGTLHLLQKGLAYPIGSGQDILAFLQQQSPLFSLKNIDTPKAKKREQKATEEDSNSELPSYLTPDQKLILKTLSNRRGLSFDQLIQKTLLPVHQLLSAISSLELLSLASQKNGLYFTTFVTR